LVRGVKTEGGTTVLRRRANEFDGHLVSFIFTGTSPGLLDSLSKCAVGASVSVSVSLITLSL